MIEIHVPGTGETMEINHLVLDFNGTLGLLLHPLRLTATLRT